MKQNMCPVDQWIRIIVGITAGWEFLIMPAGRGWLLFFSAYFFLSGMLGSCPLYTLIGVGTQRSKARGETDVDAGSFHQSGRE